jgi:hypothetical protein
LLAEPYVHVGKKMFDKSVRLFLDKGFRSAPAPRIGLSRAAVFEI